MKWKKFTLETTTDAVDYLGSMFDDIGIEGMEIEDNVPLTESETKGMFIDILPELPPDDGTARVSFYLDEDEDTEEKLKAVREGLEEIRQFVNIGTAKITESETDDKDWINNWKQYFKPFTVDHILIKPTWEEIPEEHKDKLLIQIDPGTAFGTGKHETTQLCIRQLEKYVKPGDTMLDMGCGSGILSEKTENELTDCLLGFRYWIDEPGNDAMWFWSENHALMFHTCQLLAGELFPDEVFTNSGLTGRQMQAKAKNMLYDWFVTFRKEGFTEDEVEGIYYRNAMRFFEENL